MTEFVLLKTQLLLVFLGELSVHLSANIPHSLTFTQTIFTPKTFSHPQEDNLIPTT